LPEESGCQLWGAGGPADYRASIGEVFRFHTDSFSWAIPHSMALSTWNSGKRGTTLTGKLNLI
jgi:hypothetical protein